MKKIFSAFCIALIVSCNINVDNDTKKDSATRFDSLVQKADTTLERWGDSAKAKYKDVKEDVKDRFDRDSASRN